MIRDKDILAVTLKELASSHWKELRRKHNHVFMTHGPGGFWETYKMSPKYREEVVKIRILRDYCGLSPEL